MRKIVVMQAMKIQMDVEKAKAGRRVGSLLAALLPLLLQPAAAAAELQADPAAPLTTAGWQEVYYSLILVERMAQHTPRQVEPHMRPSRPPVLSSGQIKYVCSSGASVLDASCLGHTMVPDQTEAGLLTHCFTID